MKRIRWKEKLLLTAIIAMMITLMYLFKIGCPVERLTGFPCPGCGMTRACLLTLKGRFTEALGHHWMVWSLPLLYLIFLTDGRLFRRRWANHLLMSLLAAGFGVHWCIQLLA